jgi:hypothetical protein
MRRNKINAIKPKSLFASLMICTAVCLAGIGYVWAKSQNWGLSEKIKELETRLEVLRRDNAALQRGYAAMCSPSNLDARVRELELGLAAPLPSQIIRLSGEQSLVGGGTEGRFYASTNDD